MKKVTLLLFALVMFASANAQMKEEVDLMQAAFGMEKKAMVSAFIQVDETQKDAFWALYDEYETARKEYGKTRIQLLEQYAEKWETLTNEEADKWTAEVIKLGTSTDKLITKYYNKIKKVTNPVVALQFYQIENYILSGIRLSVLESLPLPEVK
jgi:F0F1-type ATP synthase delta subunit